MSKLFTENTAQQRLKNTPEKKPQDISTEPGKKKKVISLPVKIFVVGFMGTGKTYWGQIWASRAGLAFFDLDATIENAFGMNISDIFDKKGEEKFRELERYHLRKFEHKENFLLACGGGTPCFSDNMEWMKQEGKVIYLKADAGLILQQVTNETEQRPLLKKINSSELLLFIQKKLLEREPYYSKADFILNVQDLHEDSISILLQRS